MVEFSVGDPCLFKSLFDEQYYPCIILRKHPNCMYNIEIVLSGYPHYDKWSHNNHHRANYIALSRLKVDSNDIRFWKNNR